MKDAQHPGHHLFPLPPSWLRLRISPHSKQLFFSAPTLLWLKPLGAHIIFMGVSVTMCSNMSRPAPLIFKQTITPLQQRRSRKCTSWGKQTEDSNVCIITGCTLKIKRGIYATVWKRRGCTKWSSKKINRDENSKQKFWLQSARDCLGEWGTAWETRLFYGLFVGASMSFEEQKHRCIIQQRKRQFAELESYFQRERERRESARERGEKQLHCTFGSLKVWLQEALMLIIIPINLGIRYK